MHEIVEPTLRGMNKRGSPFRGVLFAGLMVNEFGPKVIEFNVRFGDPEAEVILPRLRDDLLSLLVACASGTLRGGPPRFCSDAALAVVMAARGYPGEPLRGSEIKDLKMPGRCQELSFFTEARVKSTAPSSRTGTSRHDYRAWQ